MTTEQQTLANLDIRPAEYQDLTHILEMWMTLQRLSESYPPQAFGEPDFEALQQKLSDMLDQCINNEIALILVATVDNRPVGTLSTFLTERKGYENENTGILMSVWVEPKLRRYRIASQLLEMAQGWAKSQGAQSLQVGWHPANSLADAFWRAHGFAPYETIGAKPI